MLSPLTPTALNSKSPASALEPGSIASKMPGVLQKLDDITWDEETSSPFVTELAMDEAPKSSPLKKMSIIEDNSPSVQLRLEAAPFTICEDETSMPPPKSTVPLSMASPLKNSTATLDSEVPDSNDDVEENVDDTCFSAFSEVPNADMTRFSQLGQRSPTKQLIFDNQVRLSNLSVNVANNRRQRLAPPSAPRPQPSAPRFRARPARRPRHTPSAAPLSTTTRPTCCSTSRSSSRPCRASRSASAA
jgi:hypothetical protein